MFYSIQSEEVVISPNDWVDVLNVKPYSDIKIISRDYKAKRLSTFAKHHGLVLKKEKKNQDSVPSFLIINGKAKVVSLKPLNFAQWEKLKRNFKDFLKANYLPEDLFVI